jgi:hypothetical protein
MALCVSCQQLRIQLLPDPVDRSDLAKPTGFRHSVVRQLLETSQRCPLCALVVDSFHRVGHYYTSKPIVETNLKRTCSSSVLLRAGRKGDKTSSNKGAKLTSVEVLVDHEKNWFRGRFYLYAPPG